MVGSLATVASRGWDAGGMEGESAASLGPAAVANKIWEVWGVRCLGILYFSECDNVGARGPLGACTTHGSVVVPVTSESTLYVVMA